MFMKIMTIVFYNPLWFGRFVQRKNEMAPDGALNRSTFYVFFFDLSVELEF